MNQPEHPFALICYFVIISWASKVLHFGDLQNIKGTTEEAKGVLNLFYGGPLIIAMGNR